MDVAGHDANVRLEYLSNGAAEELRHDVLRLASGRREAEGAPAVADASADGPTVLAITPGRAVGSVVLSETTVMLRAHRGRAHPRPERARRRSRGRRVARPDAHRRLHRGGPPHRPEPALPGGRHRRRRADRRRHPQHEQRGGPARAHPRGARSSSRCSGARPAGGGSPSTGPAGSPVGATTSSSGPSPLWRPTGRCSRCCRISCPPSRAAGRLSRPASIGTGHAEDFTPAPRRARLLRPIAWRRTGFLVTHACRAARAAGSSGGT